MGKGSSLLGGRVNVRRLINGTGAAISVDGIEVAVLIGSSEFGYYWPERPERHFGSRVKATDFVIRSLIEEGRIDPTSPKRQLRDEAFISDSVKAEVFERDQGLCQYCLVQGKVSPGTEFDHFIPAATGGDGSASNVQLACADCNRKKWHRHPEEIWGDEWAEWGPLRDRSSNIVRVWRRQ